MKKILIIKHGALGDLVQAEGAIRDICNHHQHDHVSLLTEPLYGQLFVNHPGIDQIVADTRQPRWHLLYLVRLMMKLRRAQYDCVIDLQNSSRTVLYYNLLRPVQWFGRATLGYLVSFQEIFASANIPMHHIDRPQWGWLQSPVKAILAQAKITTPFILLLPGASANHPEKRWPYYAELARRLQNRGHCVAWAPGPDERSMIDAFPATCLLDGERVLSISQLASLAAHTQLIVGNDSGPTHLLSYCGTRGVVIFQRSDYAENARIKDRYQVACASDLSTISVEDILAYIDTVQETVVL